MWRSVTWRYHSQTWGCLRTQTAHTQWLEMTAIDMEVRALRHELSKDSQRLMSDSAYHHGDDSHRHGGTLGVSDMNGCLRGVPPMSMAHTQWPLWDDSHRHGGSLSDMNCLRDSQRLIHSDHMEMTAIDMEVRTLRHELSKDSQRLIHSDHMEMTAIDMEVRTLRHELSKDSQRTSMSWLSSPCGHCAEPLTLDRLSKDSQRLIHSDHMEMSHRMEVPLRHELSKDSSRLISHVTTCEMTAIDMGGTHSQTRTV